ncbi:MAG: glycosyltransferase family 4 protein [Acidimicrobiia bacterium]
MRLVLVTNDYPPRPGGIQQYLGNLVDAFPGDVLVLAPADGPAATGRGESIVRRDKRTWMFPSRRIARWVDEAVATHRADAVLFGAPLPLPLVAKRLGGRVPVGVVCHGAEISIPAVFPVARSVLRRALREADVRFAVSHHTQRRVGALTGMDVRYLGGGVDIASFAPRPGPGVAPEGGPFVLGCVSRFVPRKGQDRIILAARELRRGGHEVEVLLVGKGRKERSLRSLAERSGVPVRFEIDVAWDRLPALYGEMDVFCMPCRSRWGGLEVEGLGLVFLEAAATGLPVIAGLSGGAPETVEPGVSGYLVGDADGIVSAVEHLIATPSLAEQMGAAGRARAEREFTWATVADRLVEGFRAVR